MKEWFGLYHVPKRKHVSAYDPIESGLSPRFRHFFGRLRLQNSEVTETTLALAKLGRLQTQTFCILNSEKVNSLLKMDHIFFIK